MSESLDEDERVRIRHQAANMRGMMASLDAALGLDAPLGSDLGQAIAGCATTIAITIARADAYRRALERSAHHAVDLG